MTAEVRLARWQDVAAAAPRNWYDEQSREWLRAALDPFDEVDHREPGETDRIIDLIIVSREAMPALLAFAEAVLAYTDPSDHCHGCPPPDWTHEAWSARIEALAAIRDLVEQHLGGLR